MSQLQPQPWMHHLFIPPGRSIGNTEQRIWHRGERAMNHSHGIGEVLDVPAVQRRIQGPGFSQEGSGKCQRLARGVAASGVTLRESPTEDEGVEDSRLGRLGTEWGTR